MKKKKIFELTQKTSVTHDNSKHRNRGRQCWPPKHKLLKLTEHDNRFYKKTKKKQIKDKYAPEVTDNTYVDQ